MTLDDKKQKIIEKINNGEINYTDEDKTIIMFCPELLYPFIKFVNESEDFPIDIYFREYIEKIVQNLIATSDDLDFRFEVVYCLAKCYFRTGKSMSEPSSQILDSFGIENEDLVKRFDELREREFRNPNNKFERESETDEFLIDLLDAKRYDVLEHADIRYQDISQYVKDRIEQECPCFGHHTFINTRDLDNHLNDFSTNDSFQYLADAAHHYFGKEDKSDEDLNSIALIKKIVLEKIESCDDLSDYNVSVFGDMFNSFETDSIFSFSDVDVIKKLFDKNCIDLSYILVNRGILHEDEVLNKIDILIDQGKKISTYLFDNLNINIFENEKYLDYFISQGEIDFLLDLEKKQCIEGALARKIPDIIENIENNNPKYEYIVGHINDSFTRYPELCKAILKKGELDSVWLNEISDNEELMDQVFELSKRKIVKANDTVPNENSRRLAYKLADNGSYSTLFESFGLVTYLLDNKDYLLEKMDNDYFSYMLIKKGYLKSLADDKRIINKILTNPILVDKMIEEIGHDEYYEENYCNDETFELVIDHLASKYSLNKEHLERIEKQFGGKIILYIGNENIQQIVNLDDETFNKFMELFPKVQYTTNDVEASYESLIQYSFGRENVEDISIFPSLVHSIEDNDIDNIKVLRRKLVTNTNEDYLDSIIEKHGLVGVRNTGDLIDLIVYKYRTEERDKYIDILHELTNEYISNCRTNYRNNHLFDKKYPEYSNLMDKILNALDNNDEKSIEDLLQDIEDTLDNRFYSDYDKDDRLPDELKNPAVLMQYVIAKVKNAETSDDYLPVLKRIVDYYHDKNRDLSARELVLGEELRLRYKLDEKSKKNVVNKYFILNCTSYYNGDGNRLSNVLFDALREEGFSDELIIDCFKYYRSPKDDIVDSSLYESEKTTNNIELVQRSMSKFVQVANKIIRETKVCNKDGSLVDVDFFIDVTKHDQFLQIKRNYEVSEDRQYPYKILSNLNVKLICDNVLTNEDVYNSLLDIMKKKKLHMFPDYFDSMLEKCGISTDISNIAAFMSFFPAILDSERKRLASVGKDPNTAFAGISSALLYADTYGSVSSIYSQILGEKDAKLIKTNAGPNEARLKIKNNERLNEAVLYTAENFKRGEVTIPTFDENVTFGDENNPKQMNAIVGNFTDGCNVTHGERTGACMRIGGEGETLFKFCLRDKNGFHIRFEDPETHEYISRVSGFRNGNTVFLNELRCSCNADKYSDKDVVKACMKTAKLLIEKSKDSTCPIENVVIAKQYALLNTDMPVVPFDIADNKVGLPSFYSDIGNSGIVLATVAKDKPIAPINFDKSKVPIYEPCRAKVKLTSDSNELFAKINRVASIKTMLSGVPIDQIDKMEFPEGLLCGAYSDDWYIYVDNNKEIHYDFIDIDKRAEKEVTGYLELVDSLIERTEKDNEMRGDMNYGTR